MGAVRARYHAMRGLYAIMDAEALEERALAPLGFADAVLAARPAALQLRDKRGGAREMLELLRGREHVVHSGLCLWRRPDDRVLADVETTRLVMDPISVADLAAYLATDAWEGKAGAFGYQDGLDWVHIARGSESNVVGLPLELLQRLLEQLQP